MAKADVSTTIKRPVEDVFAVAEQSRKQPEVVVVRARVQEDLGRADRRGHNDALRQQVSRSAHRK